MDAEVSSDQASTESALTENSMLYIKMVIDTVDRDLLKAEAHPYGWCRGARPVSGLPSQRWYGQEYGLERSDRRRLRWTCT